MADNSDVEAPHEQQSLLCVENEQSLAAEKLGLGFANPNSRTLPHLQEEAASAGGEPLESSIHPPTTTTSIVIDDDQQKLIVNNNNINNSSRGVCDVEFPDPPFKQYVFPKKASPDSQNVEAKLSEIPPPPPVAQENVDSRQREEEEEKQQQIGVAEDALVSQVENLNLQPIIDGDNIVVDQGFFSDGALIGDGDGGFNNQAPQKIEGLKNGAADDVGHGLKQCEEAESQRGIEMYPVVEGNGEENKVLEGSCADENGDKWSETENWGGNDAVQVKEEFEQGTNGYYATNISWAENGGEDDGRGFEAQEDQGRIPVHGRASENWRDSGRGLEKHQDQGVFDNYDDKWWVKGKIVEEANGYGNGDSEGFRDDNYVTHQYPLRPDAEDCSFYMKTGTCKFGPNCRFNHPIKRRNQAAKEPFKQKEVNSDRPGQTECKYHMTSGGCKYGITCRYNHSRGRMVAPILKFNFLGLPIRPGEKECHYYMQNGSCKYGSNCRYDHPDPTAVGGDPVSGYGNSSAQVGSRDAISGHASVRTSDRTAPYVPVMYPPTLDAPTNMKQKGYQATTYPPTERRLPTPPAFAMNIPVADTNFYAHHQQQFLVEEFPERPGQPECSYFMKTGDCMYKSGCKFHHPKNRIVKNSSFASTDQSLPFKPEQNICTHYSRYGSCKFGPSCRYNHPSTYGNSASSARSTPAQPQYGSSASDGDWNLDPRVQRSF